jgi:DNA-binding MarR family transcriptional regulator
MSGGHFRKEIFMAHDIHHQITAMTGLTVYEKLVLWSLADHYNKKTKKCCPSWETIIAETSTSSSSVHRAMVSLKKKGLIESLRSKNAAQYNLLFI